MHRPDTMIEIHRERVQDQTVEMFSGDKYTESVDGTGYSATATLDLTLDRVWFILDAQQRLWQEEADGETQDPLRHFAIDLRIFDSKIV
ncbi:MAG: two-component system, NarL family, nitrate/nitrite sensor histidine kinase NarX, partial [Mycobacterium sp.]|nr:two-component system, NarL family, nitrate/nitrite sensor histidine kinase NarX [Mycobacterium sp.]